MIEFTIAFCVAFTASYFAVTAVKYVIRLVRETVAEKKAKTAELAIAAALIVAMVYLRTRAARVTECTTTDAERADKAEAEVERLRRDFHLVEEEEPRERFPDADEVYSR